MATLFLGYGPLFGFANGTGYGFALVLASHALSNHRGTAMGVVTAMHAVGATAAAWLFRFANMELGHAGTLIATALVFAALGMLAAFLLWRSDLVIAWPERRPHGSKPVASPIILPHLAWLWLSFGTGSMADLMALGPATAQESPRLGFERLKLPCLRSCGRARFSRGRRAW